MHHLSQLFGPIISNLESIVENGGYIFIFISTIWEGFPVIGQLIPGHTIVIMSGFLSKLEVFNIYIVLAVVITSAFLGDIIGFVIGKKYGLSLLIKAGKKLYIKEESILKSKSLILNNPAKTLILGRFSPITRCLTPFITGASGVTISKFLTFDFIGVVLWSVSSIALGYIFGASYSLFAGLIGKYILIAIILGILIAWAYKFVNKRFHIFAKYELITLGINLASLYLFFKTIQDALSDRASLAQLDFFINNYFATHSEAMILSIMHFVSLISSAEAIVLYTLFLLVYLFYKRKWKNSLITILAVVGGEFLNLFLKAYIARPRPALSLFVEKSFGFPSGHTVATAIFLTLLIYFFVINIKNIYVRETIIVISVIALITVGFSRLYMGVHWFSDILGGLSFGIFWTTLMILLVKYIGGIVQKLRK